MWSTPNTPSRWPYSRISAVQWDCSVLKIRATSGHEQAAGGWRDSESFSCAKTRRIGCWKNIGKRSGREGVKSSKPTADGRLTPVDPPSPLLQKGLGPGQGPAPDSVLLHGPASRPSCRGTFHPLKYLAGHG